ncbi:MAG: hypothetical protein WA080_06030 [Sulfuricurvum sp.]
MNMTKSISIIFYKGSGTLAERLIRVWTSSLYAHCEFGRSDGLYHSNDRFTFISRTHTLEIDPDEWDVCTLILPAEIVDRVERRQVRKNGTHYDWMGIVFSQIFRLGWHSKTRWFCSKSNADDLLYAYRLMQRSGHDRYQPYRESFKPISQHKPNCISPQDLFEITHKIALKRDFSL